MFEKLDSLMNIPFLFGIGGIGDLILLMSDENYDKYNELGLIFWANNPGLISDVCNKCFPKLKIKIITKNYVEYKNLSTTYYKLIINNKLFLSSAHIPKNLNYVGEWKNVSDVFTEYNISKQPEWIETFRDSSFECGTVIVPVGSASNKNLIRIMLPFTLEYILNDEPNENLITLTTKNDLNYYKDDDIKLLSDNTKLIVDSDIETVFKYIVNAKRVYSVDTYAKTLSRLANIPTVLVKSIYLNNYLKRIGLNEDPSDNIFLKNWNFEKLIDQSEILKQKGNS